MEEKDKPFSLLNENAIHVRINKLTLSFTPFAWTFPIHSYEFLSKAAHAAL